MGRRAVRMMTLRTDAMIRRLMIRRKLRKWMAGTRTVGSIIMHGMTSRASFTWT